MDFKTQGFTNPNDIWYLEYCTLYIMLLLMNFKTSISNTSQKISIVFTDFKWQHEQNLHRGKQPCHLRIE